MQSISLSANGSLPRVENHEPIRTSWILQEHNSDDSEKDACSRTAQKSPKGASSKESLQALPIIYAEREVPLLEASIKVDEGSIHPPVRWACLAGIMLVMAHTWGIASVFGVCFSHYVRVNLIPGTTEISYSFIGACAISQITFIAPLITTLSQRIGARSILFFGALLQCGALIGASFATRYSHLLISQGLVFGWGSAMIFIPCATIIPQHVTRLRGLAAALGAAGCGIGSMIYALATEAAIEKLSLAWSLRVLGVSCLAANLLGVVLIRSWYVEARPFRHSRDVLIVKNQPELLILLLWVFCCAFAYTAVYFALPGYAISLSLSPFEGAFILAVAGASLAVISPILGLLSDVVGYCNTLTVTTLLAAMLVFLLWTFALTFATVLAFAVLIGPLVGTCVTLIGPVSLQFVGHQLLPAVQSLIWVTIGMATFMAWPIACLLLKEGDGWSKVRVMCGCLLALGAVGILVLRGWKTAESMKERGRTSQQHQEGRVAPRYVDILRGMVRGSIV